MAARKLPVRRCVGCGEGKPKKELVRIVRTNIGEVLLDPSGKMSGRGAYICPKKSCLKLALKKKSLDRSLEVKLPTEVEENLVKQIGEVDTGNE